MKYRKKPVVIEAIKYEKVHIGKALSFCGVLDYNPHDNEYYVKTLEGHMKVTDGDYIIKGVHGEYYPCKPDIFEETYERGVMTGLIYLAQAVLIILAVAACVFIVILMAMTIHFIRHKEDFKKLFFYGG